MRVFVLDSTLRAGIEGGLLSFRLEDRLAIVARLDELGIDIIEAGAPAASLGETEFFARAAQLKLKHARLAAFGCVREAGVETARDPALRALVEAGTPVVTVRGESWDARVFRDLQITESENLKRIRETVAWLKAQGREVIYDAADFFDGYQAAPEFTLRTVEAALDAGAAVIALCDTNGGTLPARLAGICDEMRQRFDPTRLGIQARNDCDVAVANTFAAVEKGITHVQGTVNGYGPRCGWANLCSVLPGLELKLGHSAVWREHLEKLTALAHLVAGAANLPLSAHRPYVGRDAFRGLDCDDRIPWIATRPEQVGNRRTLLVSDLAARVREYGGGREPDASVRRELEDRLAQLDNEGYEIEAANGTFELIARDAARPGLRPFDAVGYEVSTRQPCHSVPAGSSASVTLVVGEAVLSATVSANGPVDALHLALRTCLAPAFPAVNDVRLVDYRVHVLDHDQGSAARVRVLVEWSQGDRSWTTMGIARNVIEASWRALTDGLRLELMRLAATGAAAVRAEDYSWAV